MHNLRPLPFVLVTFLAPPLACAHATRASPSGEDGSSPAPASGVSPPSPMPPPGPAPRASPATPASAASSGCPGSPGCGVPCSTILFCVEDQLSMGVVDCVHDPACCHQEQCNAYLPLSPCVAACAADLDVHACIADLCPDDLDRCLADSSYSCEAP